MSSTKLSRTPDEEFASKKKKMHPRPIVEGGEEYSAQKTKTENKSAFKSASKRGNSKSKTDFTKEESSEVVEHPSGTVLATTPMKTTPNKNGFRSCKGRNQTPHVKSEDISDSSATKENVVTNPTPTKLQSAKKNDKTAEKVSACKSPLDVVEEAKNESERKLQISVENVENVHVEMTTTTEEKVETVEVDMTTNTEEVIPPTTEEIISLTTTEEVIPPTTTTTTEEVIPPTTTEIIAENGINVVEPESESVPVLNVEEGVTKTETEEVPVVNNENGEVSQNIVEESSPVEEN